MGNRGDLSKHLQSVGVHDSETTQSSTLSKGFDEKRGSRFEFDFGVFVLRKFRWVLDLGSAGLLSRLPKDLGHLARNLGGTRKDNRTVSRLEDTRVLLDGDQSNEGFDRHEFSILFVVDDVTRVDLLILGNTLDGKTNGVTRSGRIQNFLVLFDGEDLLSLEVGWDESNLVTRSESSLFDGSADDLAHTLDVVDVGDRQSKGSIGFTLGGLDEVVEGIDNGHTRDLLLGGNVSSPTLVPSALAGVDGFDQVVAIESGVRNEWHLLRLVADHLKHLNEFVLDFLETVFGPVAGVHLVDTDNNLFDTQEVKKTRVLAGLSFFDTKLGIGLG